MMKEQLCYGSAVKKCTEWERSCLHHICNFLSPADLPCTYCGVEGRKGLNWECLRFGWSLPGEREWVASHKLPMCERMER